MKEIEIRGYIKTYDEKGKLIGKILKSKKAVLETALEDTYEGVKNIFERAAEPRDE